MYVNAADKVAVPFGVITTTSLAPELLDAGVVIEMEESVFVPIVATLPLTVTDVAPVKFAPEITVVVPPMAGPLVTESELIVGRGGGASLTQVAVPATGVGFAPNPTIMPPAVPLPPGLAFKKQSVESVELYCVLNVP